MSDTIAHKRHLAAAPGFAQDAAQSTAEAGQAAPRSLATITDLMVRYATTSRKPALNRAGTLRLDQAELFLLSLDNEMLAADGLRTAYLLGMAEVHLAGLIELVRAVTR
jgi:hypothetical protein